MSDEELRRWQERFRTVSDVPRGFRKDVERQARRRLVVGLFMTAVLVGETAIGAAVLATDESAHGRAMGGFLIGASVLLAVVFARVLGVGWTTAALTPDEVLTLMARRLEAGRRLGRLAPWITSVGMVAVALLVLTAEAPASTKIPGVVFSAAVGLFGWIMPRVMGPRLAARAAQLERWRAELAGPART